MYSTGMQQLTDMKCNEVLPHICGIGGWRLFWSIWEHGIWYAFPTWLLLVAQYVPTGKGCWLVSEQANVVGAFDCAICAYRQGVLVDE